MRSIVVTIVATAYSQFPFKICQPLDEANVFTYALAMTSFPVTQARSRLYQLLDEAAASHEPIQITGKRANAVLVSEDDWRSIQETLYLVSIPGMRESIRKGMAAPLSKTSTKPGW
jgi:prevent-host-death family protein